MDEVIRYLAHERDRYCGRAAAFAKALRVISSLEAESKAKLEADKPAEPKTYPCTAAKTAPEPAIPTVSEIVRAAVMSQSANFKSLDIKAYIDQRHPELSNLINSDRISTQLYYLRKNGAIILVAKGTKGGPHTYRVNLSPKTK